MKKILFSVALIALVACNQTGKECTRKESCEIGSCQGATLSQLPTYTNAQFYTSDGVFNEDAAKEVVIALMKYYNYPITDKTKASIWVSDYGTGRFAELGLACIGYANNLKDGYMLQDLFLLPNQMLPEHWHEKPAGYPAKLEGWLVRNGKSYIVGVGADNLAQFPEIKIPSCHANGNVTIKNVIPTVTGEFVPLKEVLTHHWQFAGPEGAIITEVANNHVNEAVRHYDPKINDHFLGK